MPELPEVETIKNELLPHVVGRRISGVTLVWEGIVKDMPAGDFLSRVVGQEIGGITRRGKYLMIHLGSGDILVLHMKMSGSLIVSPDSAEPPRFCRAIIHLDNGSHIFFRDPRKFGEMRVAAGTEWVEGKLGPEPLPDSFTAAALGRILAGRKAPVKAALLNQKLIAGIGNMYADEALYASGINPWRQAGSLSRGEVERLHAEIRRILWAAIGDKGASVDTYFRPDGSEGSAHYQFRVAHGLGGRTCPACGGPIERGLVGNRGTYYCPRCQPLKPRRRQRGPG